MSPSISVRPMNQRVDARAGGDGVPDLLGCGVDGGLEAGARSPCPCSVVLPVVVSRAGCTATTMRWRRPPGASSSWYRLDQRGDGRGELLGEGGPVGGGGEAHLAVEREGGDALAALVAPVMSAPTSRTSRAARASSQRAESRSGERAGSGATAASAAGEMTYDAAVARSIRSVTLPLRRSSTSSTRPCRSSVAQVVVDLLPGQADLAGEHGGRAGLGQLGEQPGPDRVERDLGGGRVLDHCDVVHAGHSTTEHKICLAHICRRLRVGAASASLSSTGAAADRSAASRLDRRRACAQHRQRGHRRRLAGAPRRRHRGAEDRHPAPGRRRRASGRERRAGALELLAARARSRTRRAGRRPPSPTPACTRPRCTTPRTAPDGSVALWLEDVARHRRAPTARRVTWPISRTGWGSRRPRWLGRAARRQPGCPRDWLRDYTLAQPVPGGRTGTTRPWRPAGRRGCAPTCARLWERRHDLLAAADPLPRTLCHHDVWPMNLIVAAAGPVLLDWAFAGPGAIGEDVAEPDPGHVLRRPDRHRPARRGRRRGRRRRTGAGWAARSTRPPSRRAIMVTGAAKYYWLAPRMVIAAAARSPRADYDTRDTAGMFAGRAPVLDVVARWAREVAR